MQRNYNAMQDSPQCLGRQIMWSLWFRSGIINDMAYSQAQLQLAGFTIGDLKDKAAGRKEDDEEPARARYKRMKKNFQRTVRTELDKKFQPEPVSRIRWKLDRWNLSGFPGRTAERFLNALNVLKSLLPPRVGAAALRSAWNGWCTDRRFQGSGPCLFGCRGLVHEDSLEHYAGCNICVSFLRNRLHFRGPLERGHLIVLGVNRSVPQVEDLMRLALWSFVLYKTHNHLKHLDTGINSTSTLAGIMEQFLRDAISGHDDATRFVRNCWDQEYRHQVSVSEDRTVGVPKAKARPGAPQRHASSVPYSTPGIRHAGGNHSFFGDHLHVAPG